MASPDTWVAGHWGHEGRRGERVQRGEDWAAGYSGCNGIGTWAYTLSRSDMASPVALSEIPDFVDNTVQPSTTYTYSLTATDFHGNTTPPRVFSVTTPSSSAVDPRRVGAYPTGSYWGAGGERIDMLSGNLNFTIPLLAAQGRTGWAVPLNLLYNSQMWRNESGRVWSLEHASGISWGWRIEFGSLIPYYAERWAAPDHFVFTDGNGAQYRLDVNSNGIWSSSRNARVWFDASANLLHFADGASWTMGTLSTGPNDAGTMYPTVMEDSNGNKIMVSYLPGIPPVRNVGNQISTIEDVRGKGSPSYLFTYTTDGVLSSIASQVGTTENWTFGFGSSIPINDPFGSMSWGTNSFLTTVTGATGTSWSLTHDPSGSGELTKVTFPDGGYVRWVYGTATYSGGRQIREVTSRYVSNGPGTTEWGPYTFTHDDSANPSPTIHANTTLTDASGVGAKTWKFILPDGNAAHAWQVGLPSEFLQKASASGAVLTHDTNTWAQDADGNPYVSEKLSVMDEGQTWAKSSKVTQTLDRYGNVTQQQIFDYGNLTTPVRTYTNTWLHSWSTPHANAYIRNRLYSSTLTDNAARTVTLVANTYDGGTLAAVSGGTPMEFDTVRGASTNHVRGNVTQTVSMGSTMNYAYDVTGQPLTGMDMTGSGQSATYASATNFAAPSTVAPMAGTADVMNGHTATQAAGSSLTSSYGYTSALALASSTMPNGATTSQTFSSSTGLLTSSVSVHGATTSYGYTFSPTTVTATTNSHWAKSYKDGFGRDLDVESGTGSTVVSHVKNVYGPCACSPLGKLVQSSAPYAISAGGGVVASDGSANIAWTTWGYDGLGRTLTKTAADGSVTSYLYQGNTTKVTDAKGNWKRYTNDALGNLVKVEEPNPAYGQADSAGTNFVTNYTYDLEGHLVTVSMPRSGYTQARSFNYDLPTGRLTSVTQPENGTVSYTYYASGRLQQKLDAKGQKVIYSYDGYGRLEYIDRYPAGAMYYDPCQSVQLTYDGSTGNSMGRVASALIGDMSSCGNQSMKERYSYTAGGLITYKGYSMMSQINYGAFGNLPYSYDFGSSYYYDTEGHMTGYGDGSGNTMTYTLDTMGRPTSMTESGSPGKVWTQNVGYGPAGEMKTMQFRTSTGGYYTEARSYNNRVQMTELSASGVGLTGLDLQYSYGAAGSNIGKIASITDAISGEQVTYMYDALQRLSQSETTHSQTTYPGAPWWGQSFGYDGFGNLTTKSPTTGHTATSMSLSVDPVTNHITSSGFAYDANGNMTSIAAAPSNIALSYDVENRTGGQWFDMENRPMLKNGQWYLYGLHGERLGTFTGSATVMNFPGTSVFYVATTQTQTSRNIYFAGRLIQSNGKTVVRDQVGSVRVNEDGEKFEYYPFGEEITLHNPQDREKFGTYTRDAATGLDDANQRTYASVHGVFSSPDRYQASAGAAEPGSWNRYAYVGGDPVNFRDSTGMHTDGVVCDASQSAAACGVFDWLGTSLGSGGGCDSQTLLIAGFSPTSAGCGLYVAAVISTAQDSKHQTPTCNVEVVGQGAGGAFDPFDHTYIHVTVGNLFSDYIEGIPVAKDPAHASLLFDSQWLNAQITIGHSNYSTHIDFSRTLNATVLQCGFLLREAEGYSNNTITYNKVPFVGPNSNSFTHSLLNAAGIDIPFWWFDLNILAPGWSNTSVPFGTVGQVY